MTTEQATEELARAYLNGDWSHLGEALRILTVHGKIWHADKINRAVALAYLRLGAEAPHAPEHSWHHGSHPIQTMAIELERARSGEVGEAAHPPRNS